MPTATVIPVAAPSRLQLYNNAQGVISDRGRYDVFGGASAAPATQLVTGCLVGLRAGDSVTGIVVRVRTAAAGTAPTTARVGLASAAGVMLAISGNLGAATNWTLGAAPLAFAAPYVVTADGGYFLCMVVNGTWGTTQPLLMNASNTTPNPAAASALVGAAPISFQWAGQSDLPAVGQSLTLSTPDAAEFYYAAYGAAV